MEELNFDSIFNLELTSDKMKAFLSFKFLDERTIDNVEELIKYIHKKGIVHGLQVDTIEKICKNPLAYFKEKVEIASGEPSTQGRDGYVKMKHSLPEGFFQPEKDNLEKVDLKEVTKLDNVTKGQLIAELIPPTSGTIGKTVTGEELPPIFGKADRIKAGKNVLLTGDGHALYSAIDGLISITKNNQINVFPVFEVNGDVDYRVGNIDFVGTVVIRGNVLTGFKVKASGDIRVIGGVEGAELESEGSIEVTAGIMASGKGSVKAGKNVKSSFIQDAVITAGEDVIVSQSIMHSHVKAGRSVLCDGSKGLIVGGNVQASENVKARTIGNTMSTSTIIEVGVNPSLREEQIQLKQDIRTHTENLDRTEKALAILNQMAAVGQLTADRLVMRQKLLQTKNQTVVLIDEAKGRQLELEKLLENSDRSSVSIQSTVYGGVKIVIGRYTKYIKDSTSSVIFRYKDGDIVMIPYF